MSARDIDLRSARALRLVSRVFGDDFGRRDDPAEAFHEASKIHPRLLARQTRGHVLEHDRELAVTSTRAVRRRPHRPTVPLPTPALPRAPFAEVVERRRSARDFGPGALALADLASLLHAAYGVTHQLLADAPAGVGPQLRTVPSGGALYPLELYLFPWRVERVANGLYHFDPSQHVLELIEAGDHREAVVSQTLYPDVVSTCALFVFVTGVFWRTRFKYGLRGYRFALIESGHVVQNLLLAATALDLGAVPLSGFYDGPVDKLLSLDGVNESTLYAVAVGSLRAPGE